MAEEWTPDAIRRRIREEVAELKESSRFGDLAEAVAMQESYMNPNAKGDNGNSLGIFQLQPAASIDVGINPLLRDRPALNIKGGVRYLKQKLDQAGGDEDKALRLYNGGGDPNYVQNVRGHLGKTGAAPGKPQGRAAPSLSQSAVDSFLKDLGGWSPDADEPQGEQGLPGQYEAGTLDPEKGLVINIEKGRGLGADARPVGLTQLNPDMDDDEILERLGYDPALVKKSKLYRPGNFKAQVTDPNSLWGQIADTPIGGIARGARDPLDAIMQLGSRGAAAIGLGDQSDVAYLDALVKLGEADYQQNWRRGKKVDPETGQPGMFNDPSRLLGSAAIVPIPGGAPATLARGALRGAATGAVSGALQPNLDASPQPGSEGDQFWSQKGTQTATGALFGGILGTGQGALTKGLNARARRLGGPAQALDDLGEQYGVRLTHGDVHGGFSRLVESVGEQIPMTGTSLTRKPQQQELMRAGTGAVQRAYDAMKNTDWGDLKGVFRAVRQGGRRGEQASIILNEINNAGDDWSQIVQASGKLSLFRDKLHGDQLYDKVEQLAKPLGNMQPKRAIAAIDEALKDVNSQAVLAPEVKREVQQSLERIRNEITPHAVPVSTKPQGVVSPWHSASAQPPQAPGAGLPRARVVYPDTSYERIRKLESNLKRIRRNAGEQETAFHVGKVQDALREDMDDFANKSGVPALVKANREANTHWRERVVKYREGTLARAIEKDMPDEIANQFLRKGEDRAQFFYDGLTKKGQAAVRAGMMEQAFQKATNKSPETFHPGRFVDTLKQMPGAQKVFFQGPAAKELSKFTRLMDHLRHAGDVAEAGPSTGRTILSLGLTGGAIFQPAMLLKVLGGGHVMRALLMTNGGRRFLDASARLQPGSPRWQRAATAFLRQAGRAGVLGVAQTQRGGMPQEE